MYWSNDQGWVDLDDATIFDSEKDGTDISMISDDAEIIYILYRMKNNA